MEGFQARKRSSMLLEQVGLGEKADFFVESLSRGMKQRLGLARALLHLSLIHILKEDERQDKIITTVWGVGYKIEK